MAIFDTFSKRQKRLKGEVQDVFTYDRLLSPLRTQICHIWNQALGNNENDYRRQNPIYSDLEETIASEFGLFELGPLGHKDNIINFFVRNADHEQALDMIDLSFKFLTHKSNSQHWRGFYGQKISSEEAIHDLNRRFLEHGIGYEFISDGDPQLIRKDNQHLHEQAVIPALRLLHNEGFGGANEEYRLAHEYYRQGKHKACLNECLKAFESTMKTICTRRKWEFGKTDTASSLINICLKNGLLPDFMQTHLGTIKSALESAIPTLRNKLGGHGQGTTPTVVPSFYAEYLLHETATTIVFLVEAYKNLK